MNNRQSTTTAGWQNGAVLPALALALLGLVVPGSPSRAEDLVWPAAYEQLTTLRATGFGAKTWATSANNASCILRDGYDTLHLVYMDPDPDRSGPQGSLRHAWKTTAGVWRFGRVMAVPAALHGSRQCYPSLVRLKGEDGAPSDILVITWIQKNYDAAGEVMSAFLCAARGTSSASGVSWSPSVELASVGQSSKYPSTRAIGNGFFVASWGDNQIQPYDELHDRVAILRVDSRDMTAVMSHLSGKDPARDVGIGVGPDGMFAVVSYEIDQGGDPSQRYLVYHQTEDGGRTWDAARPVSGAYDPASKHQDPCVQVTASHVFIAAHGCNGQNRGISVKRAERRSHPAAATQLRFFTVRWTVANGAAVTETERAGDGYMPNLELHQAAAGEPIRLALSWRKTGRGATGIQNSRWHDVGLVWCRDARDPQPRLEEEVVPYDDAWPLDPSGLLDPELSEEEPAHFNTNARNHLSIDPKTGRPRIDLVWLHTQPWEGEEALFKWDVRVAQLLFPY